MRLPLPSSSLVVLLALPFACAQGSADPSTITFSSGFSADGGGTDGDSESESDGESATSGQTSGSTMSTSGVTSADSGSADDGGNPMCCMIAPTPGCGSAQTESCVCTSQPSCCQQVWSSECVELAAACGDPYCTDDSGDSTGNDTGVDLPCDPGFDFIPLNPAPGVSFEATYTDGTGWTYIGMRAQGPSGETVDGMFFDPITGMYTWHFDFLGLGAGVWTFEFTRRDSMDGPLIVHATCQKQL